MIDTNEIRSTLNDLIQSCKDGEQGFREAADGVKNTELRTIFLEFAQQRSRFAADLQSEVAKLGGAPETSGSVGGALHRGWVNLKSAVSGHDDGAIIAEAERGEDVAVESYRKALKKDLPRDIRDLVERQSQQVQQAHNRIRGMELRSHSGLSYPDNV